MKEEKEIYVVDDSHIIVSMIVQSVNQVEGLKATAFKAAEEMLIAAEVIQPDLVILDYFLDTEIKGGLNGGQAAKYIRAKFPESKILLISGTGSKTTLAEIALLDIDAHIHKDEDDILELINAKINTLLNL
ncbi:MAG: response regulator [Crocinitomicaceae bacterium]